MADVDFAALAVGIWRNRDAQWGDDIGRLIENSSLVRFAGPLRVFEDDNAISLGPAQLVLLEELLSVIQRFAVPDPPLVIDVEAGRIDAQRLRRPELELEAVGDFERLLGLFRRKLGMGVWNKNERKQGGES